MQSLQEYNDPMDTSVDNDTSASLGEIERISSSIADPFRRKSLVFATFPWSSIFPIVNSRLVEQFEDAEDPHYALVRILFIKSMAFIFYFLFIFYFSLFFSPPMETSIWSIPSINTTHFSVLRVSITVR